MKTDGLNITLKPMKVPDEFCKKSIWEWLIAYEKARNEAGGIDMSDPALIEKNAENLSRRLSPMIAFGLNQYMALTMREVVNMAYAAGLGRPLPTVELETPPVSAHPKRAVQSVERDPQTMEVLRTVTDYQ